MNDRSNPNLANGNEVFEEAAKTFDLHSINP